MCGIHGIIALNSSDESQRLRIKVSKMLDLARHRGPDQDEIIEFDSGAIGMNRLSITAPGENSTIQKTSTGNTYAVFNGEIVNHHTLRELLKEKPPQHCDSAIILPLFKQFGQEFAEKLAGMFAIAVYDAQTNRLQLWRDPIGVKPLYYVHNEDYIIFSSEIKSIYAVMDNAPEPDFAALDHTLHFRFHPGRQSIFPDIQRVLPGETVVFENKGVSRKFYSSLRPNSSTPDPSATVSGFGKLLKDVVTEYAQADVPGGVFVSGGLDSSLIASIAMREQSAYQQPISIKFLPDAVVDQEYGQLLERFFKAKFEWVEIDSATARSTAEELVAYLDEPLEHPIHVGTYLMAKRAADLGIKTILTGDGADETFLGYERYKMLMDDGPRASAAYTRTLWAMSAEEAKELYTLEARQKLSPMLDVDGQPIEPIRTLDQALMFDRRERLSEYHDMRVDRMTMANSVEARVPLQDHRLVDYSLRVPASMHFGTSGKEWIKEAASTWLPKEVLYRKKVHFPNLPDQWLGGEEGREWAASILLDPGALTQRWLKKSVLERYINEHKSGVRLRGRTLWAIIILELWLKQFPKWRTE